MKHKKMIALLLALMVALPMAACKKDTTPAATSGVVETTPQVTTTLEQTTPAPTTTPMVTVPLDTNPLIPQDRIEGTYEQWLAAAAVLIACMENPEAELVGVYALSQTPYDNRMQSRGVLLCLKSENQELWLQCVPLEAQRKETGTRDLYAMGIGYNTYQKISAADVTGAEVMTLESLEPYIQMTMLPSIYER